jgi:hypothetical protein
MTVRDTSPEAEAMQVRVQQRMTGEQRLLLALDMSLFARKLAALRIRQDHPEWTDWEIKRELLRLAFLPQPLPPWVP